MKANIKLHCLKNLKEISSRAFDLFSEVHNKSNNRFYIVPGGSTPTLFFNLLSEKIEDWKNTQFILSDERLINDKKISNDAMVEEALLRKIEKGKRPKLLKYNRNGNQSEIENILKTQKPNLTILGLGSDGHTASLFPGDPEIFNKNDGIFIKTSNNWEDFDRISLTFNYLMKSEMILFLVSGKEKAKALKECLEGNFNPVRYPAQFIFQNYKNEIHVVCDNSAGKYFA